jgi:hypothetical protein
MFEAVHSLVNANNQLDETTLYDADTLQHDAEEVRRRASTAEHAATAADFGFSVRNQLLMIAALAVANDTSTPST